MHSDSPPREPQSWEHLFDSDPHSSTGFRIGVVTAILIHAAIFAVTWPTVAQAPPEPPEPALYRYPLTDLAPTPPDPEERILVPPIVRPDGPPIIDGPAEDAAFEPTTIEMIAAPPRTVELVDVPVVFPDPPDPPPDFVTVHKHVDPPEVTHRVDPRYTEAARYAGIRGAVILDLIIDAEGRVESIQVLRGLPLGLTRSAVDAVGQWRFQPSMYNNRPVAVRYILTVTFDLH